MRKDGNLRRGAAPLIARACVKRIYTDMAVIDVKSDGLVLREVPPRMRPDDIQANTAAMLKIAADCREIDVPETFKGIQLRK